ncbi:MAG TPA: histidine kinase [Pyrinomonadaceae bacterium]|nr:histidine kinase [Pyrinomonadaceae bacterium]
MNSQTSALLINLLGFTVGIALYALLLAMVVRHRRFTKGNSVNFLLLATAVLGLLWNVGELFTFLWRDFANESVSPFLTAVSYSALGFLPSVVVHSAQNKESRTVWLTITAYALSAFAAFLHLESAIFSQIAPSNLALQILTYGSLGLIASLLIFNFRQTLKRKTILANALLIFAVSALHLSGGQEENFWLVELVAHQSSLPLALAILYQDYRFAFADLFLKRAVSLLLLALTAFGLYIFVALPLLSLHAAHAPDDVQAVGVLLTLWIVTALVYPSLHRFAVWLVDKIILKRADYETLRAEISETIENQENAGEILDKVCEKLAQSLTANKADWKEISENGVNFSPVEFTPEKAEVFVPTAEKPFYHIVLGEFRGGRHLLSDEISMLEAVGLLTARKIDALRVTHERCELEIREQEFSKLAAEAQLTALRAQINPHFLFNALTTIGYLIQTSPDKAFETLMRLTQLLRKLLRQTDEFCRLDEERNLIESYLEIERARFEEKLQTKIEAPQDLLNLRVPSLILQPLVENAIKHGISKNKNGGEVRISAKLENRSGEFFLVLTVSDTGAGTRDVVNSNGVGLNNIRQRLKSYYGRAASLRVENQSGTGTKAEIKMPVSAQKASL